MAPRRKGKKAASGFDSEDEATPTVASEDAPAESAQPAAAPKRKDKKPKAKKKGKQDWGSDDDVELAQVAAGSDDEVAEPVVKAPPRSKAKKKPVASVFALLDEDAASEEAAAAEGSEAEEAEEPVASSRSAAGFAALDGSDTEAASPKANGSAAAELGDSDEEAPVAKPPPKKAGKKKGKKSRALDMDDDFAEAPQLMVAEVVSLQPHPNADKLKVCMVDSGSGSFKVVTNAVDVREGMKVVFAPVGCTTPGSGQKVERATLRGVDSFGMLCSAFDIGWVDEPDGVLVELPKDMQAGDDVPPVPPEGAKFGAGKPASSAGSEANRKKKQRKGFDADAEPATLDDAAAGATSETAASSVEASSQASGGQKKKKKGKQSAAELASSFEALGVEDEPAAEADADDGADAGEAPQPVDAPAADADDTTFGKKKKKGKKKIDADSVFAAMEGGEGALEPDADDAISGPRQAAKLGQQDIAAALEGLDVSDSMPSTTAQPAEPPADVNGFGSKKKKGKKAKAADEDIEALLAQMEDSQPAAIPDETPSEASAPEAAPAAEPADTGGKKKKKKGKAAADEDIDALLAQMEDSQPVAVPEHVPAEVPATDAASLAEPADKGGKKKKKKGKAADDEDIDALLAQMEGSQPAAVPHDAPPPEPLAAEALPAAEPADKGGKKKKKKGKAAAESGEDLDAILAELGVEQPQPATPASQPPASTAADPNGQAPTPEAPEPAGGTQAEADEDAGGDEDEQQDTKGLTAAQKKKLKKKAKEKAKKGGGNEAEAAPKAAVSAAAPGAKGGKKVSAAVRKMQEQLEAQRAAEEEARRLEEERIRKEEEEARQAEEEAQRKAEEDARKKAEKKARREAAIKSGELLVGKAKRDAERNAAIREQLLKNAAFLPPGVSGEAEVEPGVKKKVVYTTRKKKAPPKKDGEASEAPQQQAQEQQDEAVHPAEVPAEAAAEAPAPKAPVAPAAEAAAPEAEPDADEGDDWEAAADSWEEFDEEKVQLPGEKTAAKAAPAAAAEAPQANGHAVHDAAADDNGAEEEEAKEEGSSEEGSGSEDESGSESESSSEEESTSYESDSTDSEEEREERLRAAKEAREQRLKAALEAGDKDNLRSPICCILGHVDTGKTKILDNIRRTNVQDAEAGGITQQIGATYVPGEALQRRTEPLRKGREFELKLPGLLIIDTPGHESFTNLRSRGSSLCDIAILVVDLMHGMEQQTIESINLLKMRKTPFIVALNKVDRLFDWKAIPDAPIRDALDAQKDYVRVEFEKRLAEAQLNLNEQGLNVALYWKNPDPRKYVNIVPTSAITGEGIPDMLQLLVKLTQAMMAERLMFISELQCTVLEVKVIEGLGTTVDVVLVNGVLHESDTIVLCGLQGPIVTNIRSLLTPHPLKELRVRGSYLHHKEIKAAQGIKIAAPGMESAVAGTQLYVVGPKDDVETLKQEVMEDMTSIFSSVDRSGEGVCVQASTLGSLEALLEFLKSDAVRIPVSAINIGPIHKRDVMRASVMLEKGRKKYACLLAFDVEVTREARELAEKLGVRVFQADIIYHLFDQFTAFLKQVKEEEQEAAKLDAVFPCILKILPSCVFNKKDPIVVGVDVEEGVAKIGTPLCVSLPDGIMSLGRIASLELNHKPVESARKGDSVAMKIDATNPEESSRLYGRHFDHRNDLISKISRKSIDLLKHHFKDEMSKDDWRLIMKLKKTFHID